MANPDDQEERLTKQVHDLRSELEHLVSACKTTEELRAVIGVIAQANTYLSRALALAISSFTHGGTQPRPGEAYSAQLQAQKDLDAINSVETLTPGEGMSLRLRHMLHLQSAASYASAGAYESVAKVGGISLEAMCEGATE